MEGHTKGPWVWAKPQAPCSAPRPWLPLPGPHLSCSSQGLTGPIGPPGPAGANGEKVSHGPLSSLCPHQISFSPAKDCSLCSPGSTAVTLLLCNCCKG